MTNVLLNQQIMQSVQSLIGFWALRIILTLAISLPVWILLTLIKDYFVLKFRRNKLIADAIISLDSFYCINSKIGFLRQIGSYWLKLENPETHEIHYVSIEEAMKAITKLHWEEPKIESTSEIIEEAHESSEPKV